LSLFRCQWGNRREFMLHNDEGVLLIEMS
jgi:hypothetical protein